MRRFVLAAVCVLACALGCGRSNPGGDLSVELVPDEADAPARIEVRGLSSSELRALDAASWTIADWQAFLRVSVPDSPDIPVAGDYGVTAETVRFVPAFPFDSGRSYAIHLDPARLPQPRPVAAIRVVRNLPAEDPGPPVEVTAVYPSGLVWPENLLRIYVHFSGPMSRQSGSSFVHLVDDQGREVTDAFLASPVDFWSPDQRRVTVLFDPGRVKSDLVPNQQLGRALRAGHRYTLVVAQEWADAHGRPLAAAYRRPVEIGPPMADALSMSDWDLSVPAAGSTEPLVVTFPAALDHALLERALGVARGGEPLAGSISIGQDEREWRFTPASAWTSTEHDLVALSVLEDPQGNLIDQAFEVSPTAAAVNSSRPDSYQRSFTPR